MRAAPRARRAASTSRATTSASSSSSTRERTLPAGVARRSSSGSRGSASADACSSAADGQLRGRYVLPAVPRGRYRVRATPRSCSRTLRARAREIAARRAAATLLVYPRLVELDRLFTEAGARRAGRPPAAAAPADAASTCTACASTSRASRCARCTGRTTARRGELMVKELEDRRATRSPCSSTPTRARRRRAPRLELRRRRCARPARSSRAHAAAAAARCWSSTRARRRPAACTSLDGDWRARSSCSPRPSRRPTRRSRALLARRGGPAARALELVGRDGAR